MTSEERLEEVARLTERLNAGYRDLFALTNISKVRLAGARKVVLDDLESILKAKTWFPDKNGHYDPYRAAKEEGMRMCARDLLDKINSKHKEKLRGKDKPVKVEYDSKEKQNLHDIYAKLYKNLSNAGARVQ